MTKTLERGHLRCEEPGWSVHAELPEPRPAGARHTEHQRRQIRWISRRGAGATPATSAKELKPMDVLHRPTVLREFRELTAPVRRGRSVLPGVDSGVVPVVVRTLPYLQGLLAEVEHRPRLGDGPVLQRLIVLLAEAVDFRDFADAYRPGRGRAWERATDVLRNQVGGV